MDKLPKLAKRGDQPLIGQLGAHFTSPKKRRLAPKKQALVDSFGMQAKIATMKGKLEAIKERSKARRASNTPSGSTAPGGAAHTAAPLQETQPPDLERVENNSEHMKMEGVLPGADTTVHYDEPNEPWIPLLDDMPKPIKPKRLGPDEKDERLFERWRELLPLLIGPYLQYSQSMAGRDWRGLPNTLIQPSCKAPNECKVVRHKITALLFASSKKYVVDECGCHPLPQVLVQNGLFPSAPLQPRTAFSVELLDLFLAITERSSDAVTSLAKALHNTYRARGFRAVDDKGKAIKEPYRKPLGNALRWYDCLHVELERQKEAAIAEKFRFHHQPAPGTLAPRKSGAVTASSAPPNLPLSQLSKSDTPHTAPPLTSSTDSNTTPGHGRSRRKVEMEEVEDEDVAASRQRAAEVDLYLLNKCPACFGLREWGQPLAEGGDVHVAVDANFNHRHEQMVANSAQFHTPTHLISKAEVDEVGKRIDDARPRPPKPNPVPDEAIELCQEAHTAGTGSNVKTNMQRFDIGGLAALVCRHDIPIFITNIDTPGEQQKYAISMIERLHSMLPSNATVVVLYDIGCVVDKSVTKFQILPDDVADRTLFATAVMHSYVHQWSCQLYYSPRMKKGLGLSDGENVERLWSVLRELIGVCRKSALNRRDFLIDRKLSHIAFANREGLGTWIDHKLNDKRTGVIAQQKAANLALVNCRVSSDVLQAQWEEQKKEQLSLRAHAPARLKKELDHILTIQTKLGELDSTVSFTKSLIKQGVMPAHCSEPLGALQDELSKMKENAEEMYTSLNVNAQFPTLAGVNLTLVRRLFMLRELKASVQKRASHACFEFDKLDRAAGGKDMVLGTKMHQAVRAAMSKKTQTLNNSVARYNEECSAILKMWPAACQIPRPEPLPTSLTDLKTCTTLMESVWISKVEESHLWVRDPDVREGIRAMHKVERCVEERKRLGKEADNMLFYYQRRLTAVCEALCDPANTDIICLIQHEYDYLLSLPNTWKNDIVAESKYQAVVEMVTSTLPQETLTWMTPIVCDDEDDNDQDTGDTVKQCANELVPSSADTGLEYIFEHQANIGDTGVEVEKVNISFLNVVPAPVHLDLSLLKLLSPRVTKPTLALPRAVPNPHGRPLYVFEQDDFVRLSGISARLNDECINGLASHIQTELAGSLDQSVAYAARRCALLSSHAMLYVRCHLTDLPLWRLTHRTNFWEKDVWILPIHRLVEEHWVLAVILPHHRRVFLFDSFSNSRRWERDIPDIMELIRRLVAVAQAHGNSLNLDLATEWQAQPLATQALQSNGHDCGVWVLATIVSTLRGCHLPGLQESQIPQFRAVLCEILLSLPAA